MCLRFVVSASLLYSAAACAQGPNSSDAPFQVKTAANLNRGDAVFNISNSGASGGSICVNVYTFSSDEQEISCCSCVVTPNALVSLSAINDLVSNTLTPAVPSSIVVKLLSTATTTATDCNASLATTPSIGLLAWATTLHALPPVPASPASGLYGVTETSFTPATLSPAELARITGLCGFIQSNGSTFGICRGCRLGGLGGRKQIR